MKLGVGVPINWLVRQTGVENNRLILVRRCGVGRNLYLGLGVRGLCNLIPTNSQIWRPQNLRPRCVKWIVNNGSWAASWANYVLELRGDGQVLRALYLTAEGHYLHVYALLGSSRKVLCCGLHCVQESLRRGFYLIGCEPQKNAMWEGHGATLVCICCIYYSLDRVSACLLNCGWILARYWNQTPRGIFEGPLAVDGDIVKWNCDVWAWVHGWPRAIYNEGCRLKAAGAFGVVEEEKAKLLAGAIRCRVWNYSRIH